MRRRLAVAPRRRKPEPRGVARPVICRTCARPVEGGAVNRRGHWYCSVACALAAA